MKKELFIITMIAIFAVNMMSCDMHPATYLRVSPSDITVSKICTITSTDIDYDGRKWSVKEHPSWVKINKRDNTLFFEMEPNKTGSDREGTIKVVSGKQVAYVKLKQRGKATSFDYTETRVHFTKNGGSKSIYMNSDGEAWKAKSEVDWLKTTSLPKNYELTIRCDKNDDEYRRGTIFVREDNIQMKIEVTQGGTCDMCQGSGQATCGFCSGMGVIYYGMFSSTCPNCGGYRTLRCSTCGGGGERN